MTSTKVKLSNRIGEFLRFIKYLPNTYLGHVLELQRRFNGLEDDLRTLYFDRGRYVIAPNDIRTFRTWQKFFSERASAAEVAQFILQASNCSSFLDIGAGQGLFSAIFCRTREGTARVVAVEPVDANVVLLRQTFSQNAGPSHSCSIAQIAVLDRQRETQLRDESFDGFFTENAVKVDGEQSILVTTLDDLCRRYSLKPDLIKIDVDGFEYEILLGSPTFLRDCPARIHLELHFYELARRGKDAEALISHLLSTHRIVAAVSPVVSVRTRGTLEFGTQVNIRLDLRAYE